MITAGDLATKFESAKPAGPGSYIVKCPAHEDSKASLSISEGANGGVVLHCHAGCEPTAVLEKVGLTLGDLMPAREQRGRGVATYDYRDEAGVLLYQVVRYEPKDFRQRHPDGNAGWVWKLGDTRRVLYRLPELLSAGPDQTVFIPEGEKDVDRLHNCGLVATCNVGGASKSKEKSKWLPAYSESLRGRHVVLLPDNDEPGRAHAAAIFRQLQNVAASVSILELPGLPEKGDVSDWLNAGGTKEELLEYLIGNEPPDWLEPAPAEEVEPEPEKEVPLFRFLPSAEFFKINYQHRYLVDQILIEGQPAIMGGRSKTLKTSLAVDLAMSLGTGGLFLGKYKAQQCNVGLISGESGEYTIQETARRIAASKGIDPASASVFWEFTLPQFGRPGDLQQLGDCIRERDIRVLMIDPTYLCLLAGDTDGTQTSNVFQMGALLGKLTLLGKETGTTTILIHHCKKWLERPYEPPELEDLSGAGFAEWARQWLLIGRREPYSHGSGLHKLWLQQGGSAGHQGLHAIDVNEGIIDEEFGGRKWDVQIRSVNDVRAEQQEAQREQKAKRDQETESIRMQKLVKALKQFPEGETATRLRDLAGLNADRFGPLIASLLESERAVVCEIQKNGRKYEGFKPTQHL